MRILGLILGILGGLAAGLLGMKWLGDASHMKTQIDLIRTIGASTAELDKLITAGYVLIGSMVAGIVGGILAMVGKGKIAALLMLAGALVPAIWAPKALVFTCLLLLGGIVSFFAKPRQTAVSPWQRHDGWPALAWVVHPQFVIRRRKFCVWWRVQKP